MVDYVTKLASTIQGEAAGQAGQFAVASTMLNRVNAGIDTPSSLLSVGSFAANNHFTTPSAFSMSLAQGVQNGDLSAFGNTGNATYYNGVGGSSYNTYVQGGGTIIAGNVYSDRYNQGPSSDFQAPQYGGGQTPAQTTFNQDGTPVATTTNGSFVTSDPDYQANQGPYGSLAGSAYGTTDGSGTPAFGLTGPQTTQSPLGTSGNVGSISPQLEKLFNPSTSVASVGSGADGTGNSALAALSSTGGGGLPLQITDASTVGQQAGQSVQQGLQGASKSIDNAAKTGSQAIQGATTAATAAGTSWLGSIEYALTDIGIRAGLVLIAVALLAGAWVFFAKGSGDNGERIVPIPV